MQIFIFVTLIDYHYIYYIFSSDLLRFISEL